MPHPEFPERENSTPTYGRVRNPGELGALARSHRKHAHLTLQDVSDTTRLGLRFLSEFERGKPNASIGRVLEALQALGLDVLLLPREEAERYLQGRRAPDANSGS